MSEENTSNGGKSLSGIIGFVVIVGLLTGFNHWRQSSSIKDQCKDNGMSAEFCSCLSSEMMSELGIPSSLPLVGRFIKSDEKWDSSQISANASCAAKNF